MLSPRGRARAGRARRSALRSPRRSPRWRSWRPGPRPSRWRPTLATRPRRVAVTGGIGAGKSEALAAFRRQGAAVLSADEIVHRLYACDREVREALLARYGTTDRSRIGAIVFSDPDELAWLEGLIHPRVRREYLAWLEA
ncbi:MAG: hypothetical protein C4306_09560, partial [Thermoleophilia bacterium]